MDNFQWTTELVKEFQYFKQINYPEKSIEQRIQDFIESKQPKPEWEILLCQLDDRNEGNVHTYQPDKCLGKSSTLPPCHIYSVKRLSDGEVFSIGDKVKHTTSHEEEIIIGFNVHLGLMYANHNHGFSMGCCMRIDKIEKVIERKWYWAVKKKTFDLLDDLLYPLTNPDEWETFETKEAAKQYILENKPKYSFANIKEAFEKNNLKLPESIYETLLKIS